MVAQAREAAFRFLAYRPRSEAEVRRRLARNYPDEVIAPLLETLLRQGLIDDLAFAQQWRTSREQSRQRAQRLIRMELLRLGVSSDVIAESLEGFDEHANAVLAGERQARRLAGRGVTEEEFRRRVGAHLQRRGFGFSLVRQVVQELWEELGPDPLDGKNDADNDE